MGRLGNCNVAVAFRIYCLHKNHPICVNVSLFMLAKLVAKLATPAGSCIAWSMEFSPMVKCLYQALSIYSSLFFSTFLKFTPPLKIPTVKKSLLSFFIYLLYLLHCNYSNQYLAFDNIQFSLF